MRIRSIKPEFWRSDDVNDMRIEDRLLFIGLWSYVDDNGVGIDRHSDICADLFAHDLSVSPHDTLMRVHDGLNRLADMGVIVRYSVGRKQFLEITNWEKHQRINRPSPGRYPRSGDQSAEIHAPFTESSLSNHEPSLPGTGEQGNRGTGEQGTSSSQVASDPRPDEPAPEPRPDVDELLDLLDAEIEANGNKAPNRTKANRDSVRLLLDRDEYTPEQIRYVIGWCQRDNFWKANILSPKKLREKFPQLVAKIRSEAERPAGRDQPRNSADERMERNRAVIEELRQYEEQQAATIQGELL